MRARLVVNPTSGLNRSTELLPAVTERLRQRVQDLEVVVTTTADDAIAAGEGARRTGCEAIYVAGGDGTLNLVLKGLVQAGNPRDVPIGVIPFGTGNDFARTLDLGVEPLAALDRLLEMRVIDVDLGVLNGHPFVNVSAGGFVADVSSLVTEGLKDATGKLAYFIGGVRALIGTQPFTAVLSLPDASGAPGHTPWPTELDLQMFAVCNARTIAGGRPLAPAARVDDGVVEVFLVRQLPTLEFVAVLQRLGAGTQENDERVWHFRTSSMVLRFDRAVRVNADGELLETDECRYVVEPRAVRFFCGPDPAAVARPAIFNLP